MFCLLFNALPVFAIDSNQKGEAIPKRDPFRPLFEIHDTFNDVEEGAFKGSCGIPDEYNLDEKAKRDLSIFYNQTPVSKSYIFFSLTQHYTASVTPEIRFYETTNFILKPAYVLNREGLTENGKLICKWKFPYSEDILFKNILPDCLGTKHEFLAATSEKVSATDHRYCMVLNVYGKEIENGIHYYKTQIGKKPYYIDTMQMPLVRNGTSYLTPEKRAKIIYEKQVQGKMLTTELLIKIQKGESFKKLNECYISKDKKCVLGFVDSNFLLNIGDAGQKRICQNIPNCLKEKSEVLNDVAIKLIGSFIMAVNDLSSNSFSTIEANDTNTKMNLAPYGDYEIKKNYGEHSNIEVLLEGNEVKFTGFEDGLGC